MPMPLPLSLWVATSSGMPLLQATELSEALSKAQSGAGTCKTIRDTAFPLVLRYLGTGLIELWLVGAPPR